MPTQYKVLQTYNFNITDALYIGNKNSTRIIEIACGTAGGVLLFFVAFIACCCCVRRHRHQRRRRRGNFITQRTSHKGYEPLQMDHLEKKGKSKGKITEECKHFHS